MRLCFGTSLTVCTIALGLPVVVPSDATAQEIPVRPLGGAELLRPSEERLPEPELEPDKPAPTLDLPPIEAPSPQAPIAEGPTFVLRAVRFTGNSVIEEKDLEELAEEYVGRRVSIGELRALRREITLLYVSRGYVNSGAVLPDQVVQDGTVEFHIVEGSLSAIIVAGTRHLNPQYVSERLELASGPPLNVNDLRERIRLLLDDPMIDRINATLEPGDRPGDSRLDVNVEDANPFGMQVTFDNYRNPSVGELEDGLFMTFRDVTGWGDSTAISLIHSEGYTDGLARFEMPVDPHDTRVFLRLEAAKSHVIEEPFDEFNVDSESSDYELGVSHPLYRRFGEELTGAVSLALRKSETFLLGQPFSFAPGVQNGTSKVAPIRFHLGWIDRGRNHVVAARSMISVGLDWFGATINPGPIPDGRYVSWLNQFQLVRRVNQRGDQLVLRADGQITADPLLPLEKYGVGGARSVRGYRENLLVRDLGFSASIEGRIPIFRMPIPVISSNAQDGQVELAPFFDMGGASNAEGPTPDPTFISSIGIGLRWQVSRELFASIYYAEPLNNVPSPPESSLQDDGITFQLVATPF